MPSHARLPRILVLALLPLASAPALASAQGGLPDLERGDRVRVFSKQIREPILATLMAVEEESLVVRRREGNERLRLYLDRIERLERRVEGGSGSFLTGALIGGAATVVGGLVLSGMPSGGGANMGMAGGILLAPVGALVGGVIAVSLPGSRWEHVPLE